MMGVSEKYLVPKESESAEALSGELVNLRLEGKNKGSVQISNADKGKDSLPAKEESQYPLRPTEPDCSYYLRTGYCRYGPYCKFNHPPERILNQVRLGNPSELNQVAWENLEGMGQAECKYYLLPGGCRFGKACRYGHYREKTGIGHMGRSFFGFPVRPGEKECPYYMRTGCCKFSPNCRFHHPVPTAVSSQGPLLGYHNIASPQNPASGASQLPEASRPSLRISNEPVSFLDASRSYMPAMLFPQQNFHPNPDRNGHQDPAASSSCLPERNVQHSSAPTLNCPTTVADSPVAQQTKIEENPSRPVQFYHPTIRLSEASASTISPIGLPLRPDQQVCIYYSRYGVCKYGPACQFDHPMNYGSSVSEAGQPSIQVPTPDDNTEEANMEGSGGLVQQPA